MTDRQVQGTDTGYAFGGSHIEKRTMPLKNGLAPIDDRQKGVMVSGNPDSPWHQATFLIYGTFVRDVEGGGRPAGSHARDNRCGWRFDVEHSMVAG